MPIAEVMVVLEEILSALGAAHGAGVVHRDMKPSNIFLCRQRDGTRFVKILDFGIAKLGVHGTTPQTQASMLVGTPSYMAPEQARGGGISPAMDLYAVGVIAFEMITGQLPFMGNSVVEVLMKHAEEPPVKPSSLLMSIPDDVDDLILKLLAKKPADRYPSAESVRVDVVRIRKALADSTARRTELDVELDKRLKKQLQTMVLPDLASSIDLSGGEDATMPPSVRPDMRPRQPQQFATSEDVTLPPDSRPHLRPQNPPSVISPLAADTRAVPQLPPPPPHDMTGFPIPARGRAPAPEEDEATIPPQLPPEEVDKSKLPLLLVLGFVAVLAVGVAWFFLHERPPDVVDLTPPVKPLPPERPRPPSKPVEAKDLMPGAEPTTPEPVKPPEPAPPDSARDERHAEPVKPEPTVAKPPEPIVAKPPEPVKPEPAVVKQAPPRPAPAPAPAGRSKKDQLIERFGRLETNMAQRPDKETELKAVRKFLEKLKAGSVPNDQLPNVEAAASRFEDGLK
jgi:serine/threonine-protein kinase